MTTSLRHQLTHVEPRYEMPLYDGWDRVPAADPRLVDRLSKGVGSLSKDSIVAIMMPTNRESPLAFPIIERHIRGERFGTLDVLVDQRIAAGARAALGDTAILRHGARETAGGIDGYVVRYLLATPGSGRRRGVEFLVAFPALPEEKLQVLETLYDGIIASGSWRVPASRPLSPPGPFGG